MIKNRKHKKIQWQRYIGVVFFVLIGAVCGVIMEKSLDSFLITDGISGKKLSSLVLLLFGMYVVFLLQVIFHEMGHLIFGLLTGYRYLSFRVGSFMWTKECGRLKFKKLSIVGVGGQCLMIPPEMSDGKMPFILYNLGGSFVNIFSSLIFFGLYLLLKSIPYLSALLLMASFIGFAFALINGIPLRLGSIDNDGYNTLSLQKNSSALRSFWIQMKVTEKLAQGIRLKDMPEQWFTVPFANEMKNSMSAVIGVFACSRLMDNHLFEEADRLMVQLLKMDSSIVGIHRKLMLCDRIYCELIRENRKHVLDSMLDKHQMKFMKAMKKFPSVLRTEYSYALLAEKDPQKAEKVRVQFERCASTYPYTADFESERELIGIADSAAKNRTSA